MTKSLYNKCSFTGSQPISLRIGVMSSNFFPFAMILHAKFWTACSFIMFVELVLDQTVEQ